MEFRNYDVSNYNVGPTSDICFKALPVALVVVVAVEDSLASWFFH